MKEYTLLLHDVGIPNTIQGIFLNSWIFGSLGSLLDLFRVQDAECGGSALFAYGLETGAFWGGVLDWSLG